MNKKIEAEMADRIEGVLDFIKALDTVPYHRKREAAEVAARAAFELLMAPVD